MKTLFSNKYSMLLIRGGMTLLIVSTMVTIFTISPLGTHAQWSRPQPRSLLGKTKTAFGGFCYTYWTGGNRSQALSCLRESRKVMDLLQQEIPADSFTKWPQQLSLSELAAQNLLINPQTKAPIKSQQDFLAVIPSTGDLHDLFSGNQGSQLLAALWTYKLTANNAPPPPPPPINVSDLPPSCPVNSQSFLHSELWSQVGPQFITATDQAIQNPQDGGRHLGVYDIYGRLLLQNHCSIAALAQTMELNGNTSPQPKDISSWERDALASIALANLSNTTLAATVIVLETQPDDTLIDSWLSGGIITHPKDGLTTSTAPSSSGALPTAVPTGIPASHVSVG